MPFAPHLRVSAIGRLGNAAAEIFSYSLALAVDDGDKFLPGLDGNQDVWDDVAEDMRAFHGTPQLRLAPRAVLQVVKIARIGADGKYSAAPIVVDVRDTPGGDSSGFGGLIAPQVAMACSLHTDRRGATGRGRFYLPMPLVDLQEDLRMTQQDADARGAIVAQLVANLNNQPGFDVLGLNVYIASSKGYNTRVTGASVGRVIDTMRSRRNALNEARNVLPIPS